MTDPLSYIPKQINQGSWLTGYTYFELQERIQKTQSVLPICSLGTPVEEISSLGELVLPPLYHEALHPSFKSELIDRIGRCFPYYQGTKNRAEFDGDLNIIELPACKYDPPGTGGIAAFSVDTAVEEHGPHLPLCTDTIQSYGVLERMAAEFDEIDIAPPAEYGHLTWGLPFGLSIDITPPLVTKYVREYSSAIQSWMEADALYVVDVHGSIVHRNAIQEGLSESDSDRYLFRWLHDPLVKYSGDRGDQHAGGVETALVELINPSMIDSNWWPDRVVELSNDQMTMEMALDLQTYLDGFIQYAESHQRNGIVGDVRNYFEVDANEMMNLMLETSRGDINELLSGSMFAG